ncbi:hypothetical protein DFH06DRAFT_1131606 [Mycena polygramma]|nr:hypothetical protein DFH06DRAFT_1131606 [Mycena polygramma]
MTRLKADQSHYLVRLLTPTSTFLRQTLATTLSLGSICMSKTSTGPPTATKATSAARRESQARYRARNKEELRQKARESMARLRAELSPHDLAEYKMTAREDNIRYRAENRALLAHRAVVRRARISIAKIGYDAWAARYQKRHNRPVPLAIQVEYLHETSPEAGSRSPTPSLSEVESRSPTPSLSAPSAQSTRSTPVQATVQYSPPPPLGSSFGSCPFANMATEDARKKEARTLSLPPSSAPSSSSGASEDGYDADADLVKTPRRRNGISERELVRTKVIAWLPRKAN